MFLFTTPTASEAARDTRAANPVAQAIREGANRTGAGFDFLLKTAQRESALDPEAKARTSSATGLFQFIDQTWLGLIKDEGGRFGLGAYASAIKEGEGGRLTVADPQLKQDILALRRNPQLSAVMAGVLTQKNREALSGALGRAPGSGELYMAHVLGAKGAGELIKSAASSPNSAAAAAFPEAASANRGIFFDKAGKARSFAEVYAMLGASHAGVTAAGATDVAALGYAAAEPMAGLQPGRAKGLVGLFSTEGPRGPVSEGVNRIWARPNDRTRLAALDQGPRFFPRSGAIEPATASDAAPALAATTAAAVFAPLPPTRPDTLGASAPGNRQAAAPRRGPLDLSRFMNRRAGS